MECNKTFLWFGVDFIALRYRISLVIVIRVIKIYTPTTTTHKLPSQNFLSTLIFTNVHQNNGDFQKNNFTSFSSSCILYIILHI